MRRCLRPKRGEAAAASDTSRHDCACACNGPWQRQWSWVPVTCCVDGRGHSRLARIQYSQSRLVPLTAETISSAANFTVPGPPGLPSRTNAVGHRRTRGEPPPVQPALRGRNMVHQIFFHPRSRPPQVERWHDRPLFLSMSTPSSCISSPRYTPRHLSDLETAIRFPLLPRPIPTRMHSKHL